MAYNHLSYVTCKIQYCWIVDYILNISTNYSLMSIPVVTLQQLYFVLIQQY